MIKIYRLAILIIASYFIIGCSIIKRHSDSKLSTFSNSQIELIMSDKAEVPMRVYKISNKSDSILLRTKSTDVIVNPKDKVLQTLIKRLNKTVRDSISLGVGISAPQVGILKNIILVQRFDKADFPFEIYLNPKIIKYSDKKQICREGCLSIPNRSDTTKTRAQEIIIEYQQLNTKQKTDTIRGFTAVIFQHEIDHLNGILYTDHVY